MLQIFGVACLFSKNRCPLFRGTFWVWRIVDVGNIAFRIDVNEADYDKSAAEACADHTVAHLAHASHERQSHAFPFGGIAIRVRPIIRKATFTDIDPVDMENVAARYIPLFNSKFLQRCGSDWCSPFLNKVTGVRYFQWFRAALDLRPQEMHCWRP